MNINKGTPINYPEETKERRVEEAKERNVEKGYAPTKTLALDLVDLVRRIPAPKLFSVFGFIGFMVLMWANGGALSIDIIGLYFVFLLSIGLYMVILSMTPTLFKAILAYRFFIVRNIVLLLAFALIGLLAGLYWENIEHLFSQFSENIIVFGDKN